MANKDNKNNSIGTKPNTLNLINLGNDLKNHNSKSPQTRTEFKPSTTMINKPKGLNIIPIKQVINDGNIMANTVNNFNNDKISPRVKDIKFPVLTSNNLSPTQKSSMSTRHVNEKKIQFDINGKLTRKSPSPKPMTSQYKAISKKSPERK